MENLNNFLASVHYLNHPLLSGLSALNILLMGIFVLAKDSKSGLYRAFFWMNVTFFIWFFGNALSMFYYDNFERAIFWFRFGYTGAIFMSATYYNFYLAYSKKKNKIIYPIYIVCLLEVFYLWFWGDIRNGAYVLPNVGIVWREMPAFSYFFIFGMIKYIIASAITFISFFKEYKKEINFQKKRVKWLTVVFFLALLGSIEWLVAFNIPLHIAWVLMIVFAGVIAYAIVKHHLMDINIVIKRAFFYSFGIALISGIIFGISFLNSWFAENMHGFKLWMIPLFAGIVAFVIGRLFWRKSKEVDKLKYEFITVAAHKLRTPLTDIKWAASSLKDIRIPEAEKNKLVNEIVLADERLIDLTNELLAITKAEENQYRYNFESADLEKIARKVVNEHQLRMKERNIKLIYNAEKNLPKVKMDKVRISSVIQTLLENAILYTKDEIKINIDVYKNSVIFHIEDNGIGVSKEDRAYIFSKFFRTREAYLTETEGAGIGLFLAKSIIDKHRGKIGVRSEGKGQGSIFWFSLPY